MAVSVFLCVYRSVCSRVVCDTGSIITDNVGMCLGVCVYMCVYIRTVDVCVGMCAVGLCVTQAV